MRDGRMDERALDRFLEDLTSGRPARGGYGLDPAAMEAVRTARVLADAPLPEPARERLGPAVRAEIARLEAAAGKERPTSQAGLLTIDRLLVFPNGQSVPRPAVTAPRWRGRWASAQLLTAALLILTFVGAYLVFGGGRERLASIPALQGEATAESTPPAGPTPLLRLTLTEADLPPRADAVIGFYRVTYAPGGGHRFEIGLTSDVYFVEDGTLTVGIVEAAHPPQVVRAGTGPASGTTETVEVGGEVRLETGDALVLPPGANGTIRNDGATPAAVFVPVDSESSELPEQTGVQISIGTVNRTLSTVTGFPPPPLTITLVRTTLAPGERFPPPPAPARIVAGPVEFERFIDLRTEPDGTVVNRAATPMPIYVLTVDPAAVGTPTAGTPTS